MGFERRFEIYFRNKSEQPQTLKHRFLTEVAALPAMPGGYILASGGAFIIQPGQAVRVPMRIWNTSPCAMNLWWTEEIREKEYLALAAVDQDARPEVDTRPWWNFREHRVRIAEVQDKRVYFTTEDGIKGWTSRARWEEEASEEVQSVVGSGQSAVEEELQKQLADAAEKHCQILDEIYAVLCEGIPQDAPIEGASTYQNIMAAIGRLKEATSREAASGQPEADGGFGDPDEENQPAEIPDQG